MNASRFATTSIRPASGCGAAVHAGSQWFSKAMVNAKALDRCTNPHPCVVAARLELAAYEDQMQPGEGSA
ncbi:hypothetical protein HLB44_35420 [Aquincola sp. S2]|uniref:Uncharacterized protein n=1 Tax=Pseudaquabacterium terrae TaxID=2732868 RepID=A0ABX2EUF8_9BURK|nr:hypothetical protein [Aquabacterium terrae]NRF72282.1 hypothetical protein [Aquabacterium terrae]